MPKRRGRRINKSGHPKVNTWAAKRTKCVHKQRNRDTGVLFLMAGPKKSQFPSWTSSGCFFSGLNDYARKHAPTHARTRPRNVTKEKGQIYFNSTFFLTARLNQPDKSKCDRSSQPRNVFQVNNVVLYGLFWPPALLVQSGMCVCVSSICKPTMLGMCSFSSAYKICCLKETRW